ncbi:MAG: EFR1 family ferrodoxin [Promethearchaeota archaeon]
MNKLKILILFFSGTGNTEYIARYIENNLKVLIEKASNNEEKKYNQIVEISRNMLEKFDPNDVLNYDLICLGFPIFELNSPVIVQEFLEKLPNIAIGDSQKNIGVFFFATMGFASGNAFRKNYKKIKNKGYIFLGGKSFKMSGSDGLIMMKKEAKYVQNALKKNYESLPKVDEFCNHIFNTLRSILDGKTINQLKIKPHFSILDFLFGWIFHLVYLILIKYMKKKYYADEKCTYCQLCIKICPVNNISLHEENGKKRIVFGDKCIFCLRCINQCPAAAIQIGKYTVGKFRWHGPKNDFKPLIMLK